MHKVLFLVFFICASVYSESVRETETWRPMKAPMADSHEELLSSGDSSNGSDFAFPDDNEDEDEDYDNFSGSGDEDVSTLINRNGKTMIKGDINDNTIPDIEGPLRPKPTVDINDVIKKNEVSLNGVLKPEDTGSNVLMAHAGDESFFNKTEVLAALIAGGAVGLLLAILLILLLIYRMKKKDEGSYDLGKKPIYKKAPTTEIYA